MERAASWCSTGVCGETSLIDSLATLSPSTLSLPPVTVWCALDAWTEQSGGTILLIDTFSLAIMIVFSLILIAIP